MRKPKLATLLIAIAGAAVASFLMLLFTPSESFLVFLGWLIFFLSIQVPWYYSRLYRKGKCTDVFHKNGEANIRN